MQAVPEKSKLHFPLQGLYGTLKPLLWFLEEDAQVVLGSRTAEEFEDFQKIRF